jgi:hypothetical protein
MKRLFVETVCESSNFLVEFSVSIALEQQPGRLRAGRPRGRSSNPGSIKKFLFSTSSRPDLKPTQPPIR